MKPSWATSWQKWTCIFLVALAYAAVLVRAHIYSASDEDHRHFIRGDGYSDRPLLSGVRFFYYEGYGPTKGRAVQSYDGPGDKTYNVYTHSPSGPEIFWGFVARQIGSTNEVTLRLCAILLSLLQVFAIWKVGQLFFSGRNQQRWFLACATTVSAFVFWADNLHLHLFTNIFHWGSIAYFVPRFWHQKAWRWWSLCGLFLFGIVVANVSFETIVFLAALVFGLSWCFRPTLFGRLFDGGMWSLGLGIIVGFGIHVALNAWYFGSLSAAIKDLTDILHLRAGVKTGSLGMFAHNVYEYFSRTERYSHLTGWTLIVFSLWLLPRKSSGSFHSNQKKVIWILLVATSLWYFVMAQHAYVHHWTARQQAPLVAILTVGGLPVLWQKLRTWRQRSKWQRASLSIFVLYIFVMFITQSLLPVFWVHSFAGLWP